MGISIAAAMPIIQPVRLCGKPNSAVIYSGTSIRYMALQVHINTEAKNNRLISLSKNVFCGMPISLPTGGRATSGNIHQASSVTSRNMPAANINIAVKP
ncbi:hypothetical protein D3C71_1671430 [compost metagenome]